MPGSGLNVPFYQKVLVRDEISNAVSNGVLYACGKTLQLDAGEYVDIVIDPGVSVTTLLELSLLFRGDELGIKLFEGTTYVKNTGVLGDCTNVNRVATQAGIDAIKETWVEANPTVVSAGVEILTWSILGTKLSGGTIGTVAEADIQLPIILPSEVVYTIRLTNLTAASGRSLEVVLQYIDRLQQAPTV